MTDVSLLNLQDQAYDIGRAAVLRAPYWDGESELLASLTHMGNTEGEVAPEANSEFSTLTLPENLGPAPLKKYLTGEAPTFELNLFVNPALLAILSPTGSASGGNTRQRRVIEHTLWIVPEQLFLKKNLDGTESEVDIGYAGGVWTKDGQPFTAEDTRLFNLGTFWWRVHFERALPVYRHEDGGKSLRSVMVHSMPDLTKPDGHQLWTMGSALAASGIDIEGATSS